MHTANDHGLNDGPTGPASDTPNPDVAGAEAGPESTFTIHLRFSGLCLFVPQPADEAEPAAMHVLMMNFGDDTPPREGRHHPTPASESVHHDEQEHSSHPRHYPMLYVGKHPAEAGLPLADPPVGIPLRDTLLRLPLTATGTAPDVSLPREVLPLHEIADIIALPREWIGRRPGRRITAQVVLTAGGPGSHTKTACWDIKHPNGSTERPWKIAGDVTWIVPNVAGPCLRLAFRDIDKDEYDVRPPIDLYPSGSELHLRLCCLPVAELPPGARRGVGAEPGAPADHFGGFFTLFPGVRAPELRLRKKEEKTEYTSRCVAAQVRLAPRISSAP